MKKISILALALITISFYSCKDSNKETEPNIVTVDTADTEPEIYKVADSELEFNNPKVEAIFQKYIDVESALVNTDVETTSSESSKLLFLLKEKESDAEILAAVENMEKADDIEVQRKNFVQVTESMETMLEGALKSGTIYKQYCPMAFNDTGAYWLSTNREILNPYFGDKMLKCGRVDSELK